MMKYTTKKTCLLVAEILSLLILLALLILCWVHHNTMLKGDEALKNNDYETAMSYYEQSNYHESSTAKSAIAQAALYLQADKLDEAQAKINEAAGEVDAEAISLVISGKRMQANGEPFGAITAYIEAISRVSDVHGLIDLPAQLHSCILDYGRDDTNKITWDAPDGTTHVYKVLMGAESWDNAQSICQELGGHLATMTSWDENFTVYSYLAKNSWVNVFFGLSDKNMAGDWKWVTDEDYSYALWHKGEPTQDDDTGLYGTYLERYTDGTWHSSLFPTDQSAYNMLFLCEWDNP